MARCVFAFFFMLCAFAVNATDGGNGGDGGNFSDGGNGSDGSNTVSTPGRAGCPGGTNPDRSGKFYLPGTKQQCNPGKQDAMKRSK
ncbi:hypothetical protein MOV73_002598 [Raoultella ornithinolytica]|nr:hypothetical protein [Raoultella ornithinolytica]EKW7117680.1 hypothetical protein [Raoultella ornithinolytica]ELS0865365.1 hypothetical protein [Raoultella ornithinolytica]